MEKKEGGGGRKGERERGAKYKCMFLHVFVSGKLCLNVQAKIACLFYVNFAVLFFHVDYVWLLDVYCVCDNTNTY